MSDDHDLPIEEYRRAGLEVTRGNPDVYKSLWSRRDERHAGESLRTAGPRLGGGISSCCRVPPSRPELSK
jgi:hypothetical protein